MLIDHMLGASGNDLGMLRLGLLSSEAAPGISIGMAVMILGIDTAGQSGSIALVDGPQILASFSLQHTPTISAHLLPLIETICAQTGCDIQSLEGLAVSLGPGGFTSLRVGLATAQGLAMALRKPLIGCSVFEAFVASAAGWDGLVCPVLEARRGEVYAAWYRREGTAIQEMRPGSVTTPAELCTLVTERTLFLGSGVRVYGALFQATLGAHAVCLESLAEGTLAVYVACVGETRLRALGPGTPQALTPLYIRAADARLPRHPFTGAAPVAVIDQTVPHG